MKNLELLVLLAASYLLIRLFEKGNLSVLGLQPTAKRLRLAGLLFVVTALCCSTGYLASMYFAQEQFALNPNLDARLIWNGLWMNFESVCFEELLCRGAGLYVLIQMLGRNRAILISAGCFGLLHLLNGGTLGNPVQAGLLFAYTFSMGLLLAYAFAQTRSLYIPFAIHFGWNLTQNFLFPGGAMGNTLLVSIFQPEVTVSYLAYFIILLFPKLSAIAVNFGFLKQQNTGPYRFGN